VWILVLLLGCESQDRFTQEGLTGEAPVAAPATWALEDNRPQMVRIEPGSFSMGSAAGEAGRAADEQQHQVTLERAFLLSSTEVSQGLYRAITGRNPAMGVGDSTVMTGERLPVQGVSWLDAVSFCNSLSEREGLLPAYTISGVHLRRHLDADGYRLPTEAEWEYAARAGEAGLFSGAADAATACSVANVADSSVGRSDAFPCSDGLPGLAPVASREPNAWGLYDLTGNLWEWVYDLHAAYPERALLDPSGPPEGQERVYRGGSWLDGPGSARIAARRKAAPAESSIQLGFRLARSLPSE